MAMAIMKHGDPTFQDYTPSANVAAGDVVLLGNTGGLSCGIAHMPIANAVLGALAIGGGIYDVVGIGNYAAWTKVWWDAANSKVTTTCTTNALFGYTLAQMTAANATVEVLHNPFM